jgi:hypothetical protein
LRPNASRSYRFILRRCSTRMKLLEKIFPIQIGREVIVKEPVEIASDQKILATRSKAGKEYALVVENAAARHVQINGPRHFAESVLG